MSLPVNSNSNNGNAQQRKMERRKAIRILPNSNEALQIRRLCSSLLLTTNNSGGGSNPNSQEIDTDPYSSDSSVEVRITMIPVKKEYVAKSA